MKTSFNDTTITSPRKMNKTMTCAVLTKSNLKEMKRGTMFTMTLCDRETTSTIRAVCFEGSMFNKFATTKTYDLKYFKLKKGMGNYSDLEVLITPETKVTDSIFQFTIEKKSFKISQILRRETSNVRFLSITAKVISIEDVQTVGKYPDEKLKRDVLLADETGQVALVLWRQRAETIEFKEGDIIDIENAVTSSFNNTVTLSAAGETTISVSNKTTDIDLPASVASPSKNSTVTCIETTVSAFKDFKCQYRCINCHGDVDGKHSTVANDGTVIVRCPTCPTTFLQECAKIKNECQIMLSSNHQWFTAGTGVSLISYSFIMNHTMCIIGNFKFNYLKQDCINAQFIKLACIAGA